MNIYATQSKQILCFILLLFYAGNTSNVTNNTCCALMCLTTRPDIGCISDILCETIVCSHDSWCCTNNWDRSCVDIAAHTCLSYISVFEWNINPQPGNETEFEVFVRGEIPVSITKWKLDIVFFVNQYNCVGPILSLLYEQIDYDEHDEYIDIFDNNNILIKRCGA
eukprot:81635_1